MSKYDNQTPVIFRKWPKSEGEGIIALFPTELGTNDPYTSSSYETVGQHGSADPVDVIQRTKAAKPDEYATLLAELQSIGYDNLRVYQRLQPDFLTERRQNLAEMDNPSRQVLPPAVTGPASLKKWAKSRAKTKRRIDSPTSVRGIRR